MSTLDLSAALDTARRAVGAASAALLRHFLRGDIAVETKPDLSPVTAADRDSETAIIETIRQSYPEHGVLTEESGLIDAKGLSDCRWIVDPLDGTRGFARGGRFWGPLVALEERGQIVVGVMSLPALGETYWASRGRGAFRDGERLRVSRVASWTDATVSLGELHKLLSPPHRDTVTGLCASAASARAYGDLAACAMLLNGFADAWIEAGVQTWDLAPLKILVEEAGGKFTDFAGRATIQSGNAVGTNGLLHDRVLAALK
jgi:histidinol-phosphatase